jgi:hypothetical protein
MSKIRRLVSNLDNGPSTRVRICVRFGVRFHVRFAYKVYMVLILHPTPITTACQHILIKIGQKLKHYLPPHEGNRTRNRTKPLHVRFSVQITIRFHVRFPVQGS